MTYAFQCLSCHQCLECMLEGHGTVQPQDIQDNNDRVKFVEMCVATKILSAKGNWAFFFLLILALQSLVDLSLFQSNLRSFSTDHIFMRWSCQAPCPTPILEDQAWIITPDISGMGSPTSGYTTDSIAFRIIWLCKPHHCVSVEIPLGWGWSIELYTTEIYKMAHRTHDDIKECDGLLNTVLIKMSVTYSSMTPMTLFL